VFVISVPDVRLFPTPGCNPRIERPVGLSIRWQSIVPICVVRKQDRGAKSESGPATNLSLKGSTYPETLSFSHMCGEVDQRFHDGTVSPAATGSAKMPR
jgi:hypothetical protein